MAEFLARQSDQLPFDRISSGQTMLFPSECGLYASWYQNTSIGGEFQAVLPVSLENPDSQLSARRSALYRTCLLKYFSTLFHVFGQELSDIPQAKGRTRTKQPQKG
jgi:hypothetical protein